MGPARWRHSTDFALAIGSSPHGREGPKLKSTGHRPY